MEVTRVGDGYGYGYGSGVGYGVGYGVGSGYGVGYGSGSGDGDGYGSGYGVGYGDGDGYGYGSGYGYGYGSGYGYGENLSAYKDLPVITAAAKGEPVTIGIWRSGIDGQPSNGGKHGEPARPGLLQEVPGPLALCSRKALHATLRPQSWQGERWWLVALLGEVHTLDDKMGALRRLIVTELV